MVTFTPANPVAPLENLLNLAATPPANYLSSASLSLADNTTSQLSAASVTLPAGSYLLQGAGWFDLSMGSSNRFDFEIWNATAGSQVTAGAFNNANQTNGQGSFSLVGRVTLTASTTFAIRVKQSTTSGGVRNVNNIVLTATRITSL